ncbi:MAG TPA: aminodeoxychorismate/anthranilate synthase component II [candidate division Zixibacteria bacterium]|nr:aminodeoxychorismate/anthranilate synthase component II [candidate division Zixibacteria bacterium]
MLVMLDNYDSFTYNLVQYLSELGAELEVFRNDEITIDELLAIEPQGIVLSPGPGRPENAGIMNDLILQTNGSIPIFGVCLGYQAIAQVYGGKIDYAPTLMHGKTSQIIHTKSKLFKNVPNPFVATRYHSLIVDKDSLPKEFKIIAYTEDDIIMAIEHNSLPLYGVQFHPESIMTPEGKEILRNFLHLL